MLLSFNSQSSFTWGWVSVDPRSFLAQPSRQIGKVRNSRCVFHRCSNGLLQGSSHHQQFG